MPITNWSIRHSITIFVAMFVFVVAGFTAYQGLPREAEPDVEIPFVLVTTPYIGVSPADIETLITNPLEEELEQLKDVEAITSTSAEGASIISIEFMPNVDIDDALQKVRERVDTVEPELPPDAEDPVITEIAFSEFPVISVNISGEVGLLALKRIAEDVQDELERIPGVLEVALIGGVEREITVEADPAMLDFYGVSLLELVGVIQNSNINMPGGSVDMGELQYLVRVPGEFESVSEIEDLVIREEEGQPIYVRDVAEVIDGYEDESTYSRLDGQPSIALTVSRSAGENVIEITDEVKAVTAEFAERYEGTVDFTILGDRSVDIKRQLQELQDNIITGMLLVLAVLFFFMGGFRNALFVSMAIPLSMLISFMILAMLGVTLNVVVLFSLVLALGMLVDNAIVVVENIYRHGTMGKPLVQAAMDGVAEIAWPIISSTMTTVSAFFPLLFWPGIMGEFMGYLPSTVIIVLSSSLFVALVINPVLCATFMRVKPSEGGGAVDEMEALPNNLFYKLYGATLRFAVNNRILVMIIAIATFVGTMMIYGKYNAGMEFFPELSPERVYVNVTLPDGSNVDASDRIVRMVEAAVADDPNVDAFEAGVGAGNGDQMSFGSDGSAAHRSRVTVHFVPRNEITGNVYDTIHEFRDRIMRIPGAEFEIAMEQGGPPTAPPINIELVGDDQLELGRITRQVREVMGNVDGVVDIKDDLEAGRSEITVDVDRRAAARNNLTVSDVANTVRAAVNGLEASTYRELDDEYDILVQLQEPYRDSLEDIERLQVVNPDGDRILLTEVAQVQVGMGYGSIRHIDGDRVVTISAEVADGVNSIEALAEVQELLEAELEMPPGYSLNYTGENEDQAESQAFLASALVSALFLIALVLITQFNSITQPFIILFSVVLSLLGVFWGLMLRQLPFGVIMTGLAVISLAGVVVNNAIVLIDYTNQLRERGLPTKDAVIQAGLVRLRPVLLTAFTTALSLMPTVLGYSLSFHAPGGDHPFVTLSQGGTSVEMWGSMSTSVAAGLIAATFLTLVVVPVMYSGIDSMNNGLRAAISFFKNQWARATRSLRSNPDDYYDPETWRDDEDDRESSDEGDEHDRSPASSADTPSGTVEDEPSEDGRDDTGGMEPVPAE